MKICVPKEPPPPEHPLGHLDISKLPLITDSGVTVLLAVTPNLHNLSIAKTRCSNVTVQVSAPESPLVVLVPPTHFELSARCVALTW